MIPKMVGEYLTKRGHYWYYVRRVPQDVAHLDERVIVQRSTKKACPKEAMVIGDRINRETEAFWEELASGGQKNSFHLSHVDIYKGANPDECLV